MWMRIQIVAAVVALCVPAALLAGEKVDETFEVQAGQRLSLSFDAMDGDIDIEGWDESRVHIEGTTSGGDWRDGDRLDFEESSRGLHISPRARYRHDDHVRVRLLIRVPRQFDLRIDTATHLKISDIEGHLDVSVGNASVDLFKVKAEGRISTANGRMSIENCKLDAEISNVNGRLRIDSSEIKGEVSVVNSSMDVSNAPEGIELSSVNGHVDLGSAAKFVQVSTTNGNVDVDELAGWLDAETTNGNVRVRLVGLPEGRHTIDVETLNGNVELEIPEDYSMSFDIRIESRGGRQRYEVDSDFDLDIQEDDSRRGDQRITASGELNDGEHRVRIRTTNGDVILKRIASSR